MDELNNYLFKEFEKLFKNDTDIFYNGQLTDFGANVFANSCIIIIQKCLNVVKELYNEKK